MPDSTTPFPGRRQGSTSVGQVFALVAGFVALAAVGAMIGWFTTPTPKPQNVAGPAASQSVTVTPSSPSPTPSISTPQSAPGDYTIPDYATQGTDFIAARQDLIDHKLGVALVFNQQGSGSTVVSTVPPAGTTVARGVAIKIFVSGPAPTLQVRQTAGESCAQAGRELASDGLIVSYPLGKAGLVASTDPAADDPTATWNQKVKVYCTPDGQPPQPSDGPSSPSGSSSASPGTSG